MKRTRLGGADHRHREGAKADAVALGPGLAALARPRHPPAYAAEIEKGRAGLAAATALGQNTRGSVVLVG